MYFMQHIRADETARDDQNLVIICVHNPLFVEEEVVRFCRICGDESGYEIIVSKRPQRTTRLRRRLQQIPP